MRWADLQGIGVIEPPRAGTLNRAKVCIAGILKHALRPYTFRLKFWGATN